MKERFNFMLNVQTHRMLKEGARKAGMPMGAIVDTLIKRYLTRLINWTRTKGETE